jgi:hypothetical protein
MILTILTMTYINFLTVELFCCLFGESMFKTKPIKKIEL